MLTQFIAETVLIFAVYRMTRLLVYEQGIFGIFARIRAFAGIRQETIQRPNVIGQMTDTTVNVSDTTVGKILSCFYCCSVWVAMPAAVVATTLTTFDLHIGVALVMHWLGIAGAVAVLKDFQ